MYQQPVVLLVYRYCDHAFAQERNKAAKYYETHKKYHSRK